MFPRFYSFSLFLQPLIAHLHIAATSLITLPTPPFPPATALSFHFHRKHAALPQEATHSRLTRARYRRHRRGCHAGRCDHSVGHVILMFGRSRSKACIAWHFKFRAFPDPTLPAGRPPRASRCWQPPSNTRAPAPPRPCQTRRPCTQGGTGGEERAMDACFF